MGTKALGDLCAQHRIRARSRRPCFLAVASRPLRLRQAPRPPLSCIVAVGSSSRERPQPHRGQPRIPSKPVASAPAKIMASASFATAAQTCSRYSFSETTPPDGFLDARVTGEDFQGRAETREDCIRADDAFFGKAWHPLVDAVRESDNTSRQSPTSSALRRTVGFSRGRHTRWTDEASVAEFLARSLDPISVSIGQEAVITQPASTSAASIASHAGVSLLAKTNTPTPEGAADPAPPLRRQAPSVFSNQALFFFRYIAARCDSDTISSSFGARGGNQEIVVLSTSCV